MSHQRQVLAAALVAALQPGGPVQGEPLAAAFANRIHGGAETDPHRASPAASNNLYSAPAPASDAQPRARFGMAGMPAGPARPGTTAWLFGPSWQASSPAAYEANRDPRKEMGFTYSSDGRVSGYVARPPQSADGPDAAADSGTCCLPDLMSSPPGARQRGGGDAPEMTALLGQLRTRGLKLDLDDGWKLNAGARTREYSSNALKSRIVHLTLQRSWGPVVTAYSLQVEKRGGWNVAPSQAFQLGYAFGPRTSIGIAYASGQEIAFFGAQGMLKTEMRSTTLHGEHVLGKAWALRLDAGYYDHGELLPAHKLARITVRRSF